MITCLVIPYFAAAVERGANPALAAAPLIMGAPPRAPRRVLAVSQEAAQLGVKPGMSWGQARALYPQGRFIPANPDQYQRIIRDLASLLATFTPKVEPDSGRLAAVIYADFGRLTNIEQLELAVDVTQAVRAQTNLTPALGLASGKFPAYIAATSIGLNRVLCITPGEEGGFLAPLPVTYLPLDQQLAHRFQLLGLRTLGQFAGLPAGAVLNQFGRHGHWLYQLAQGYDDRPVMVHPSQPVEQSTTQLDDPVTNRTVLAALSRTMVTKLAMRLEADGRVARGLHLALHLEDDTRWEKQTVLRQPTNSPERLARQLEMFIEHARVCGGVVAVGIKLTGLTATRAEQLPLLAVPARLQQEQRLVELLPGLVARYGPDCFYQVTLTNPLTGLLERRFQIRAVARR